MNLFTDHDFGRFADDGFGNLIRLGYGPTLIALEVCLNTDGDFYDEV